MRTAQKVLTALSVFSIVFDLAAECNKTHVWNPLFEPHARFHVVWQLCSNACAPLLAICLLWAGNLEARNVRLAAVILLLEPIGFLFAAATMGSYDGAFFPKNVPEYDIKVLGVPVALVVFSTMAAIEVTIACTVTEKKMVGIAGETKMM
eukprot:TRINITY_DN688_c6_g1_i1.p2 TRINITY_DN688_c6_g1~~TRINITY_DN688_c6_g1_i1.p2  ORF type:complete len:150 (-),score=25.49 TRINITY_DN688_c6_g1_i1:51-500(-)